MYHHMSCCAITLRPTLSITLYNQSVSGILQFIMFYIFISFDFSVVTLTNFLHQNKIAVHLDLFHAKKSAHFNRLKMPFFVKYKGSLDKLYIIWKLY